LVTFVTKFRYVPVDTFALMIADVTSVHYWLPWLPRHSDMFCPAHIFLTCQILPYFPVVNVRVICTSKVQNS
jgi:hypothetical protein